MSQVHQQEAHCAAMALLVRDGVLGRRDAIDALAYSQDQRLANKQRREQYPPGYATARSMARQIDRGTMQYAEAEHTVALVIAGGEYTEAFYDHEKRAGALLAHALGRFERLKDGVKEELRVAEQKLAPAETPTEAAESLNPVPGLKPKPCMRPPARRP